MEYEFNLLNTITNFDMFGRGIELRIDKQEKSKTFFGGLLTIIMQVLLFLMLFFNGQDVL